MDSRNEIMSRIQEFVMKEFPLARQRSIADDDLLLDSGILDSLGVVSLVAFVEKEFEITVSDEELLLANFQSISCLATFVQTKLNGDLTPRSEQ